MGVALPLLLVLAAGLASPGVNSNPIGSLSILNKLPHGASGLFIYTEFKALLLANISGFEGNDQIALLSLVSSLEQLLGCLNALDVSTVNIAINQCKHALNNAIQDKSKVNVLQVQIAQVIVTLYKVCGINNNGNIDLISGLLQKVLLILGDVIDDGGDIIILIVDGLLYVILNLDCFLTVDNLEGVLSLTLQTLDNILADLIDLDKIKCDLITAQIQLKQCCN